MPSLYGEILEMIVESGFLEEFHTRLLEKYRLNDSLWISKKHLMDWVKLPSKGRNTTMLLQEFEKRFTRLSTLDRTVLDTGKVLLFVKAVDVGYREKVGLLLEDDDRLITDWDAVKRVCSRFDKRREWTVEGSLSGQAFPRREVYVVGTSRGLE